MRGFTQITGFQTLSGTRVDSQSAEEEMTPVLVAVCENVQFETQFLIRKLSFKW